MAILTFTSEYLQCPTAVNAARDNARVARDGFVWETEWREAREPGVATGKETREERGKN